MGHRSTSANLRIVDDAMETLVADAAAGDREALDTLARQCLTRVRRTVVLSHGWSMDTDDLVQTAMARILAGLTSFRGEASFRVWIDRVTINVIRDSYRKRRWTVMLPFDEEVVELPTERRMDPSDEAARTMLLERLSNHLAGLKQAHRLPLVLHLLHGYSVAEVAALLDLRFETAKKRLLRGRRALMKRLKRDPVCREALEMGGL